MAESFLAIDQLHSFNRTPQQGISTLAKILSRGSIILTPTCYEFTVYIDVSIRLTSMQKFSHYQYFEITPEKTQTHAFLFSLFHNFYDHLLLFGDFWFIWFHS